MTNDFNIRDFRNAGQTHEATDSGKSNRWFYTSVIAIPVIAALAGVGYKPLMDLRNGSIQAVQQAELDVEARRRAENPMYALMNGPKNADGLIDLNAPLNFGGNSEPSPEAKARKELSNRALSPQEFLSRVDAKAHGFSEIQMETLKYDRTVWALTTCGHKDMLGFYLRQNKAQYAKLETAIEEAKAAKEAETAVARAEQAKKAEAHFNQMKNIETKTQAIAFVAGGGVNRHMEAVGGFGSMASMIGDASSYKIRNRRQRFGKRNCSQVRTIVQSGTMKIKANTRLR